jgi:hypothetical protein
VTTGPLLGTGDHRQLENARMFEDRPPHLDTTADPSTRVDHELGILERVGFFGPRSSPLFGCVHAPLGPTVAAVVLCSSLYADLTLGYRRQVMFARFLAARGVLVHRFHYRGTGNSFGDPAEITYESLVEDASLASGQVSEVASSVPLSFAGVGWGAMVAASVSRDFRNAPLVLWEPLADPSRYYEEALRARMIRHVMAPSGRPQSAASLLEELEATGSIDVIGYRLNRGLYQSSTHRSLTGELGAPPRRVLLVKPDGKDVYRTDHAMLAATWTKQGFGVDVATVGKPTPIWFHGPHVHLSEETAREVASCVRSWVVDGVLP